MHLRKPFDKNTLAEYGYLKKTNGISGELTLNTNDGFGESDVMPDFLFLEIEGLPVPFKIESFRWRADETCVLKFRYVDSKEEAQKYTGCRVLSEVEMQAGDDGFNPFFMKGYALFDQNKHEIGQIEMINDYGGNLVLSVNHQNAEVLVPFHADLLLSVDQEAKRVVLNIASGLF